MDDHLSKKLTKTSPKQHYGYDTKNAMHLLRLLRIAKKLLSTGRVNVYRPDRQFLLAVKKDTIQNRTSNAWPPPFIKTVAKRKDRHPYRPHPIFPLSMPGLSPFTSAWIKAINPHIYTITPSQAASRLARHVSYSHFPASPLHIPPP